MANQAISQLPVAIALVGNELVPIVQQGATLRTTTGAIATLAQTTALPTLAFTAPLSRSGNTVSLNSWTATVDQGVLYRQSSANLTSTAAGLVGQLLTGNGTGAAPSWLAAGTTGQLLLGTTTASAQWLSAGTTGQVLTGNSGSQPSWRSATALGIDLDVGSTAITGGVSGRVLYDNAGVLGELLTTGSGTTVVLSTQPSILSAQLTNPNVTGIASISGNTSASGLRLGSDQATYVQNFWRTTATQSMLAGSGTTTTLSVMSDNGANVRRLDLVGAATAAQVISNWASGAIPFQFGSGGVQWQVNTSGNLVAFTDATNDIGASGATRPRDGFFSGSMNLGGAITAQAGGVFNNQVTVNNATIRQFVSGGSTSVSYGDNSDNWAAGLATGTGYVVSNSLSVGSNNKIIVKSNAIQLTQTTAISGSVSAQTGTALTTNGSQSMGYLMSSTPNFGVIGGISAPTVSMATGSLYLRGDGLGAPYYNAGGTTWTPLALGLASGVGTTFLTGSNVAIGAVTNVINTGSIGGAGQVWEITANMVGVSTGAATVLTADLFDGTSVRASGEATTPAANQPETIPVGVIAILTAATTFTLRGYGSAANSFALRATVSGSGTADKMTAITAKRLA